MRWNPSPRSSPCGCIFVFSLSLSLPVVFPLASYTILSSAVPASAVAGFLLQFLPLASVIQIPVSLTRSEVSHTSNPDSQCLHLFSHCRNSILEWWQGSSCCVYLQLHLSPHLGAEQARHAHADFENHRWAGNK